READSPMSVLSISARVGPSQLSDVSPEALRNGRIAKEDGAAEGFTEGASLPRNRNPVITTTMTAANPPTQCQGMSCPQGRTGGNCSVAAAVLPCQAARSL